MKFYFNILLLFCFFSCVTKDSKKEINNLNLQQYITVLGIAQDGGYPHIGCQKICCANYYNGKNKRKNVVALGLVDKENNQKSRTLSEVINQLLILDMIDSQQQADNHNQVQLQAHTRQNDWLPYSHW